MALGLVLAWLIALLSPKTPKRAIILTLILKPSGLFGQQKELEERV